MHLYLPIDLEKIYALKCFPMYILADASRVHLSKAGSKSDYINACYIDVSLP